MSGRHCCTGGWTAVFGCVLLVLTGVLPQAALAADAAERARLVLLGTGTPIPDPSASGPAVAVVVNGQSYLFDAGPGVVRQAEAAAGTHRIAALDATNLRRLFFTHLHSDHTIGYPDVILTPWVVGRRLPLEVYGPKGVAAMTDRLKEAYSADITVRTQGLEHLDPAGLKVNVHEIAEPGVVYRDLNVTIRAFAVPHGSWEQAFGYIVEAGGRTIVISGDTGPSQAVVDACHGCDVLLHEVYSAEKHALRFGPNRGYHTSFHTSTTQLGELAAKAKPKLLVLYHQLYFDYPENVDLVREIRQTYSGPVVNGKDLSVY